MKFEWETIAEWGAGACLGATSRAKVPNGWVVNSYTNVEGNTSESMCFIPDIKHEWVIDKD